MGRPPTNWKNIRVGKLTPLYLTKKRSGGNRYWMCQCDCGNFIEVSASNLKSKHVTSCGCWKDNIPLIRIPYTHLKNICLEDLLLETSKFRII